MIPKEEIDKADEDLQDFFDSLGPNDIYKQVFLEVLLEEIYGRRVDLSQVVNWGIPSSSTIPQDSPNVQKPPKT